MVASGRAPETAARHARSTAELLGLTAFYALVLAYPVLDLFGRYPEYFVIRRVGSLELVLIPILLLVLGGVPALLVRAAAALCLAAGRVLFALFAGSAAAFLAVQIVSGTGWPDGIVLGAAAGAGLAAAFATDRWRPIRISLVCLSPVLMLAPALFWAQRGIRPLLGAGATSGAIPQIALPECIPRQIFFLVLDELPLVTILDRSGDISVEFPHFKELAADSHVFLNASSPNAWTEIAVPIILSGQVPRGPRVPTPSFREYPSNLFTLLAGRYRMNVFEQVTALCPETLCGPGRAALERPLARLGSVFLDLLVAHGHQSLPPQLKRRLPPMNFTWNSFFDVAAGGGHKPKGKGLVDKGDWADDVRLFELFIDSLRADPAQPTLNFLHVSFPHLPYRYLSDGRKYLAAVDRDDGLGYRHFWGDEEWPALVLHQRHLQQALYADVLLGRFLDRLRSLGIYDKSLVLLVSDHGTSFTLGEPTRVVGERNRAEVALVPFFLKLPGQRRRFLSERNVETFDVLPTLIATLGGEVPANLPGADALGDAAERPGKRFIFLKGRDKEIMFWDLPAHLPREESLRRKFQRFPDERSAFCRNLHNGKTLEESGLRISAGHRATVDTQEDSPVATESFVPALVGGGISGPRPLPQGLRVAILVNGRIACLAEPERTPPGGSRTIRPFSTRRSSGTGRTG